jgi:toxin FitB
MSMTILDTNVVSALMRPDLNPRVVDWASSQNPTKVFLTTVSVFELQMGVLLVPAGHRQERLQAALDDVLGMFLPGRCLSFDTASAKRAAELAVVMQTRGRRGEIRDVQIAAIASVYNATLVTRNTKDFVDTGVSLVDPWSV